MIVSNITIDEFFPDYDEVVEYAKTHDFSVAPIYDGHEYPGFTPVRDQSFIDYTAELLKQAMNLADVKVHMAAFVSAREGFKTRQWIHCDNSCAKYAVVIHLHNHPHRGTKFWQHPDYGHGLHTNLTDHEIECLREQGMKADGWHPTDYVDSRPNRLVFYPTYRFHSRWPEDGIGETVVDSRLTMVLFVDVA